MQHKFYPPSLVPNPHPENNHKTETNLHTLTCIDIIYSVNLYTNLTYKKYLYFCGLLIFA